MEVLHTEKFPNQDGDVFNIRIIDWHNKIETAINLMVNDAGEEREFNIKRYENPSNSDIKELTKEAKITILSIKIINDLLSSSKNEADIF